MNRYKITVHIVRIDEEGRTVSPVAIFEPDRAVADLAQAEHIADYAAQAAGYQLSYTAGNTPLVLQKQGA